MQAPSSPRAPYCLKFTSSQPKSSKAHKPDLISYGEYPALGSRRRKRISIWQEIALTFFSLNATLITGLGGCYSFPGIWTKRLHAWLIG